MSQIIAKRKGILVELHVKNDGIRRDFNARIATKT